jgi:4-hydroxybenzoate polyprenyltransferase
MADIRNYLSLIKFSHTVFALPFAVVGFFMAIETTEKEFRPMLLVLVLLCMVFARSAAMAFNRYIDRDIDAQNPRTAQVREIPNGTIEAHKALLFTVLMAIAFIVTTYFINPLCFYLSPVALLVILGYSLTKRFTALCHLGLGLGLSLAPVGAFMAVTGQFHLYPVLLGFSVLLWVAGFDIIYALQDDYFDKTQNLFSIPAAMGRKTALHVSNLLHVLSAGILVFLSYSAGFGWFFWSGTLVFVLLLIYQHNLVKVDDLSKVNLAFFTTNGIASVIFGVLALLDFWIH